MDKEEIGAFEVNSEKVIVSDPCYELGIWCQGVIDNVRVGTWICCVLQFNGRVAELIVKHFRCLAMTPRWSKETFEVGVDSGQAGVFDAIHYRDDHVVEGVARMSKEVICPETPWYSICCDRTLGSESGAGVIPFGVVSSSGYGDGGYSCWTGRDREGRVVAIRVVFIKADEEEGG